MKQKPRIYLLIVASIISVCVYLYAYVNERTVIELVLASEINRTGIRADSATHTIFIEQVQYLRPWRWDAHSVDEDILTSLKSRIPTQSFQLRQLSDADYVQDSTHSQFSFGYYDRETGQRGMAVSVGPVSWIHPFKVRVKLSTYYGMVSAGWRTFELSLTSTGWQIERIQFDAISSLKACPPNIAFKLTRKYSHTSFRRSMK